VSKQTEGTQIKFGMIMPAVLFELDTAEITLRYSVQPNFGRRIPAIYSLEHTLYVTEVRDTEYTHNVNQMNFCGVSSALKVYYFSQIRRNIKSVAKFRSLIHGILFRHSYKSDTHLTAFSLEMVNI
jgi:hypothetical protein